MKFKIFSLFIFLSSPNAFAILGGQPVQFNEEPSGSVVRLSTLDRTTFCSGVVIAKNIILTAAHCSSMINADVVISTDPYSSYGPAFPIEKFIPHPDYVRGNYNTPDLAVIRLKADLYNPKIIPLAEAQTEVSEKTPIELTGFGISLDKDGNKEPSQLKHHYKFAERIENNLIEFDQRDRTGTCFGDSGGPAFITENSKRFIIAIDRSIKYRPSLVSNKYGMCFTKSQLTDIRPYLTWIRQNLR